MPGIKGPTLSLGWERATHNKYQMVKAEELRGERKKDRRVGGEA
jgi:hypothetical protein